MMSALLVGNLHCSIDLLLQGRRRWLAVCPLLKLASLDAMLKMVWVCYRYAIKKKDELERVAKANR